MRIFKILFLFITILMCYPTFSQTARKGKATYYANRFHGRRTSSGDVYHRDSFTCAHRSLPFGTILKVRDTKTGKEVFVKVNDRLGSSAMVDLSLAAAKELGIVNKGYAHVEITPYHDGNKVPYKAKDFDIPQIQVRNDQGDGYCSLSEWEHERHAISTEKSGAKGNKNFKNADKAKEDSVSGYRVLDQLTAQGD